VDPVAAAAVVALSSAAFFPAAFEHQVVDECAYTTLISYNGSAEAKLALLAAANSNNLCSVLST
jgi:hypothetical protein